MTLVGWKNNLIKHESTAGELPDGSGRDFVTLNLNTRRGYNNHSGGCKIQHNQ